MAEGAAAEVSKVCVAVGTGAGATNDFGGRAGRKGGTGGASRDGTCQAANTGWDESPGALYPAAYGAEDSAEAIDQQSRCHAQYNMRGVRKDLAVAVDCLRSGVQRFLFAQLQLCEEHELKA